MVLPSSQDEALARYSVSKDVPRSVLKCEMLLFTLDVTPKVPQHTVLTEGNTQVPPSLGFSRQEHWSGLPFPSPTHESEKGK